MSQQYIQPTAKASDYTLPSDKILQEEIENGKLNEPKKFANALFNYSYGSKDPKIKEKFDSFINSVSKKSGISPEEYKLAYVNVSVPNIINNIKDRKAAKKKLKPFTKRVLKEFFNNYFTPTPEKPLKSLMNEAIDGGHINHPESFAIAVRTYDAKNPLASLEISQLIEQVARRSGIKADLYTKAYHTHRIEEIIKASIASNQQHTLPKNSTVLQEIKNNHQHNAGISDKDLTKMVKAAEKEFKKEEMQKHVANIEDTIKKSIEENGNLHFSTRKEYKATISDSAKSYLQANKLNVSDHAIQKLIKKVENDIAQKITTERQHSVITPKPKSKGIVSKAFSELADTYDAAKATVTRNKATQAVRKAAKLSTTLDKEQVSRAVKTNKVSGEKTKTSQKKWKDKFPSVSKGIHKIWVTATRSNKVGPVPEGGPKLQ